MRLLDHTIAFGIFALACLVAGSVGGARYSTFREVTCLKYHTNQGYDDPQYIDIIDYGGLQSVGIVISSSPRPDVPSKCWTDGKYVTSYNQKDLLFTILITIGSLAILYIIIASIIHFCSIKKPYDTPDNETVAHFIKTFGSAQDQNTDLIYTRNFVKILATLIIIAYLSAMSYFAYYDSSYRQATCTSYALDSWQYATFVAWQDNTPQSGAYSISPTSSRPSALPADCWVDGDNVSFYSPNELYYFTSIIFIATLSVIIIFWFTAKKINQKTQSLIIEQDINDYVEQPEI